MQLRGSAGRALVPYHSSSIANPIGKDRLLRGDTTFLPKQEEESFSSWPSNSPNNERQSQLSQLEATILELSDYFSGLSVYNSPSQCPPFLYKRAFPFFVLQTYLWVCTSLLVQDHNSLLFSNKPIICW